MSSDDRYLCPGCGSELRVGTKNCPTCNPPKPWEQDEKLDGLDLPDPDGDEDFDYDKFVSEEFGGLRLPRGKALLWWITAVLLLAAFLLMRGTGIL